MYSWRDMIPALSKNYRVYLVDLLGEGDSPKPNNKKYSILRQRDLILTFIAEQNLSRLTLVGNSYGGAVSLLVTLKLLNSSVLKNLILIDSAAYPKPIPLHLKILRTPILGWLAVHIIPPKLQILLVLVGSYYDPCKITYGQILAYSKPLEDEAGKHALLQLGKQAIPKDFEKYIKQYPYIKVPTLILWGEEDRVLPTSTGLDIHKAIRYSTFKIVNQAGHVPQEEQPDQVNCQIQSFFDNGATICVDPQKKADK
jgi:pimeloyl-ACP methyl ester carboxylesterase